jgi:hypothetical protein
MVRRVVIAPQGMPAESSGRERCSELLLRCGADLSRIIEGPRPTPGQFAEYVAGIRDVRDAMAPALILLTRISPARNLVEIRDALEARVPSLTNAPWLLFADPLVEPDCIDGLRALGKLEGAIWDAPTWTDEDGGRYLVLSPHLRKTVELTLSERIRTGNAESVPQRSTFRSLRRVSPSMHPTLRVPALTDERPTVPAPDDFKRTA